MCAITTWLYLSLKLMYVTIVNPRFLKWPQDCRKILDLGQRVYIKFIESILLKQHAELYGVF